MFLRISILGSELPAHCVMQQRWLVTDLSPQAMTHVVARAAEFVKQKLSSNLIKHPKFFTDSRSAIGIIYLHEYET
uniref:Uncharacterized protein n=1 Tax=Aegilops tauschii subsp. strangulata TaxID=200361 RepID=A0A453SQR3_AEGTS